MKTIRISKPVSVDVHRFSRWAATALLSLLACVPAMGLEDLPGSEGAGATIHASGDRESGTVETYTIPDENWPLTIDFYEVRGGDGGVAKAGPKGDPDRYKGKGGGGAVMGAVFEVGTSGDKLRPGGQIRFIIGNKGEVFQGEPRGDRGSGGGGGGTGVLYRETEAHEWVPLIIAAGGAGGFVNSYVGGRRDDGHNGRTETSGSPENDDNAAGGTNG